MLIHKREDNHLTDVHLDKISQFFAIMRLLLYPPDDGKLSNSTKRQQHPIKMTLVKTGSKYAVTTNTTMNYSNSYLDQVLGPLDNPYRSTGWVKRRCGQGEDRDWFKSPHINANETQGPSAAEAFGHGASTSTSSLQKHSRNRARRSKKQR